ncbi:MAG: alkaline phosphatase family protein [Halieaceae bacterium]|jgi:predicted AlkP superfamily phosphohydrolase/phosphomutase|nr:alkaline phosphatase family protein [Halieaceae bacterium]
MAHCKVFFLVVEAAEPALLNQWMDAGLLPQLSALRDRSLHGPVRGLRGIGANAIWPSVYTGVGPATHGLYYHDQPESGSYQAEKENRTRVEQQTIWGAASDEGQLVGLVDLPRAFTSKQFNGIQVIDWNTHFSPPGCESYPSALEEQIAERLGEPAACVCLARQYREPDPADVAGALARLGQSVKHTTALIDDQLPSRNWDLFLTSFDQLHCAGHLLWHRHDRSHPWHLAGADADCDPLLSLCQDIDTAVGRVLDQLPDSCRIVLFAGPGMGPSYVRPELLDAILVALDKRRPSTSRKLIGALKTLWHHVPQSWRQGLSTVARKADRTLQGRDRSSRPCYSVRSNDSVGGIRVNLEGREANGMITAAEMESYCDRLIAAIKAIRIVDNGEPLVTDIFRTNQIYHGQCIDQLPDILIEWNQTCAISALTSPDIGLIRQDRLPDWSGTHTGRSMAMIHLPGRGQGRLPDDASVLDIAPTLAELCGLPGLESEGKSLLAGATTS